ncbi:hypothetical protein [Metaclostridioides mangenotii]|uniref:hypothetical protein n=1 Tax=Metaclostridioides mangenotii TaxID=1540 RepID=UPI00046320C0|nr:hypothetical protein [Clostridioides mangenotii]
MATPLSKLYEYFLLQLDDDVIALIDRTVSERRFLLYTELACANFYTCKKDLTIVNSDFESASIPDGETEYIFNVSNENPIVELYGKMSGKRYSEGQDYTLDIKDDTCTLTLMREFDEPLEIDWCTVGEIVSDLDVKELYILSLGMRQIWLSPKLLREENLKLMMTDHDFKSNSPANMLDKLIKLKKTCDKEFKTEVTNYSHRGKKGLN